MANRTVSLLLRTNTPSGKRYYPVVCATNGRVKGVLVGEKEAKLEGVYYLTWWEGNKCRRLSVGRDATTAQARQSRKQAELTATAQGVEVVPEKQGQGVTLDAAVAIYLEEVKMSKKKTTLSAYRTSLEYFKESCKAVYLSGITRSDLIHFAAFLRDEKEQAPRSCHNKFANLVSFLKSQGVTGLTRKGDWPEYTEEEPEIYEQAELDALFSACTPQEKMRFRFFLYSGFRDQEVQYFFWRDLGSETAKVSHKPSLGWTPKAYRERSTPLPAAFASELLASKPAKTKSHDLVFPAPDGGVDAHMLRNLKTVATRAGLNCGSCEGCKRNECERYFLHKFRATFCTRCLQGGVDLKTVQQWAGHKDLASTMRYLRAASGPEVQSKVEKVWA